MKKLILVTALVASMGAPAFAQDNVVVTTPGASVVTGTNGTAVTTGTANVVTGTTGTTVTTTGVGKSVRDMSESERAAFWDSLPEEEKQRIILRRQQAKAANMPASERGNTGIAVTPPVARTTTTTTVTTDDAGVPTDMNARIARGKAEWDAMTDDQKRAFVEAHKDEIRAAIKAQK